MSKRRMQAYYYGFVPTGVGVIDKILSAVACAGKARHHTREWADEDDDMDDVYEYHTGKTCEDWIQNAANEAAAEVRRLKDTSSS